MAETIIKRIELGVRRMLRSWLTGRRQPTLIDGPQRVVNSEQRLRILFLRQDRIGDVLVSEPIIRAVRERFPNACIHMLLSRNNLAALPAIAHLVDDQIVYQKTATGLLAVIRSIRRNRYDVVVDLMDNPSTTSTALLRGSGVPIRIGIDKANRNAYTHVVPLRDRATVHIVDRLAQLLLPFGIDPALLTLHLRYRCDADERALAQERLRRDARKILCVNVTGTDAARRLPAERWAEVLTMLHVRFPQWRILVLATPQDAHVAQRLADAAGVEALPPMARFHDVACMISCCDALLTADTSVVHVAAAASIPQVVLYVHGNPTLMPWYPYGAPYVALHGTSSVEQIPTDALLEAVETLFSRIATT